MISPIKLNLAEKLKDKAYRHRFFQGRAQDEIAQRLRYFRDMRNLNQVQLAESSGMKQSAISRIEQSSYSRWSLKTLWRIAEALDLRMQVVFEPMEDAITQYKEREESIPDAQVVPIESPGYFGQGKSLESLFQSQQRKSVLANQNLSFLPNLLIAKVQHAPNTAVAHLRR